MTGNPQTTPTPATTALRAMIIKCIEQNPGATRFEVRHALKKHIPITNVAIANAFRVLAATNEIYAHKDGRKSRYFVDDGRQRVVRVAAQPGMYRGPVRAPIAWMVHELQGAA